MGLPYFLYLTVIVSLVRAMPYGIPNNDIMVNDGLDTDRVFEKSEISRPTTDELSAEYIPEVTKDNKKLDEEDNNEEHPSDDGSANGAEIESEEASKGEVKKIVNEATKVKDEKTTDKQIKGRKDKKKTHGVKVQKQDFEAEKDDDNPDEEEDQEDDDKEEAAEEAYDTENVKAHPRHCGYGGYHNNYMDDAWGTYGGPYGCGHGVHHAHYGHHGHYGHYGHHGHHGHHYEYLPIVTSNPCDYTYHSPIGLPIEPLHDVCHDDHHDDHHKMLHHGWPEYLPLCCKDDKDDKDKDDKDDKDEKDDDKEDKKKDRKQLIPCHLYGPHQAGWGYFKPGWTGAGWGAPYWY